MIQLEPAPFGSRFFIISGLISDWRNT